MENIYILTERFSEISDRLDEIEAALENAYIDNGGEVTEDTEMMEAARTELQDFKQQIVQDIIENADEYAAIAKNKEAQRKIVEAEMKAMKEEQKKVLERYQARINRLTRSEEFWKDCFNIAMMYDEREKIGGPKTNHKFTIYYAKSKSLVLNEEKVLEPYQEAIDSLHELLPAWASVAVNINKTELKKEATLPEGAEIVEKKNLLIK